MSPDEYLQKILENQAVNNSANSPAFLAAQVVYPVIREWAGNVLLSVQPSGSYAKGTANRNGTDIDLFISISENCTSTLKEIYDSLLKQMNAAGYKARAQNVSINIRVKSTSGGEYDVDLVPGKRQGPNDTDHSLWVSREKTWKKTNIQKHISVVQQARRQAESRIIKIWRRQKNLEFPSFCIELAVIAALHGKNSGLASNTMEVFQYLANSFMNARLIDPANTNNVVSDTLTQSEKIAIKNAALSALSAKNWGDIII